MAPKPSHIHVLEGEPPIRLTLRRSARARRVTLRVSQLDGQVFLTLPHHLPAREAIAFAQSKEDWIRAHLTKIAQPQLVDFGDALLVMGHPRLIVPTDDRRVTLDADQIRVPARKKPAAPQLAAFLKDLARQQVVSAADLYAKRLGKDYSAISLRDTRSRWGSCSATGRLMFSWRLIMAPEDVLTYVAAHEVAHLREMNHSPRFWSTVSHLYGPYDAQRHWLRTNGHTLHRYLFRN